jgi:hypothetical protein
MACGHSIPFEFIQPDNAGSASGAPGLFNHWAESVQPRTFSGQCAGNFTHVPLDTFCQCPFMRLSHSGSYYYGRLFELLHEPHSSHLGKALALSRSEEHTPNVFENTEAIHRCLIASASSVRAYAADPSSVHRVATSFTPSGQWPDQPGDLEPPALRRRRRVAFLATLPSSQNSSGPEASLPGLFLPVACGTRVREPSIIPSCSMNSSFVTMRT